MINVNSYYNDSNEAAGILDTLDAHETDAQFEDRKEKNRLLHICKTKGFPHLEALGAKCGGIERNPSKTEASAEQVKQAWENIKKIQKTLANVTVRLSTDSATPLGSVTLSR